jgi:hypothetical protein
MALDRGLAHVEAVAISALERPRATSAATSRSRGEPAQRKLSRRPPGRGRVRAEPLRVVASGSQASLLAGTGQTLEELFLFLTTPQEAVR